MRVARCLTLTPNASCSAMQIEWTDLALDDLETLRDYIAKDSPYYARQFISRLFDAAEPLADHPKMGREVPEADHEDIREVIVQGYRLIYRTIPDRIQILTVIHGSRDLTAPKNQSWEA